MGRFFIRFPRLDIIISLFSIIQAIFYLVLGQFKTYITILGFVALGLESTLPIPQLIRYELILL